MRNNAMLVSLMQPNWKEGENFKEQFLDWERQMDDYTELGNATIPDEFPCAIVFRWAPKEVKQFLRNTCTIDCSKDFKTLRHQLWLFFTRHRVFDEQGQAKDETEVAELKAMLA